MNNSFKDGAPVTPIDYNDLGLSITPCNGKQPIVKDWQLRGLQIEVWIEKYRNHNIGLLGKDNTNLDIDHSAIKKFIEVYLKTCGAIYGRESNPMSHYLFKGELPYKKYAMPAELEHYMKGSPHGVTLLEIRSGKDKQSIVPGSTVEGEKVIWQKFAGINPYPGNLEEDISIIVLSAALSILYPSTGSRDEYCTAIAGVLSQHTDWSEDNINNFIYNLAVRSGDDEANKRMAKGTNAKNTKTKNFGFPKLAEILDCSVKTVAEIFEWIGVKNSGSCFTALKVYESEPKYWKLKYKDTWITIMDSSILLSYTKVSILILENCYEVAPVVSPKDWKAVVADLLKNVEKVAVPIDASYYQNIGLSIIDMLSRQYVADDDKDNVFGGLSQWGVWLNKKNMCLYTKLDMITNTLNSKRISFERRKLVEHMQTHMGAEHCKVNVRGKDVRVWKFPEAILNQRNRQIDGLAEHVEKKYTEAVEKERNAF